MSKFSSFLRFFKNLRPNPAIEGVTAGSEVNLTYAMIEAEGKNIIGNYSKVSGQLALGYGSTIGMSSCIFGGKVIVGRYCQFGPHVGIYAMNHPTNYLTLYLNRQLFEGRLKEHQEQNSVKIGNDVWLGHGTIILPDVKIGNGVIVGAGAVVTKDIEDYSIAVGNPARVLKKRFDKEIIELLQRLKWWNLSISELQKIEDLFNIDFAKYPEKAKAQIQICLKEVKSTD